jgi:hypothetical protein
VSFRGAVTPKMVNELSLRIKKQDSESHSELPGVPKIVVVDAFTGGGSQVDSSGTDSRMELTDTATMEQKHGLLKAGINIPAFARVGSTDLSNRNGTFYFSSLADYAGGRPYSFIEQAGNGHLVLWQKQIGGFVQEDLRLRRNLSLALGLRYDWQNYGSDARPPAARMGFAWSPGKSQKTIVRGGAGFFYDVLPQSAVSDILLLNGARLRQAQLLNPGYPDPFAGAAPANPATPAGAIPPNITRLDPRLRAPYDFQYSIGVERQLRRKLTLTTTWTGIRGVDLFRSRDINAPLAPFYTAPPDPNLGVVSQIESSGGSESYALQTTLRGDMSKYFNGMAIYEWGRAMNDTDGIGSFPANNRTTAGEWSRASFDIRSFFYLYGTVKAGRYFKLGLVMSANSGRPYNIITGRDDYNNGMTNARPAGLLRNSGEATGSATLDVRWSREFHLPRREGLSLLAGVDAFNLLNRVNYSAYSGDLISPLFGQPVAAGPARRLQLSLAVKF